jgi:hypothetical protein
MARAHAVVSDPSFLSAALEGLEIQKQRIEEQIRQVKSMIGKRRVPNGPSLLAAAAVADVPRKKRVLSTAARKRIAAAQKKRWAEFHKNKSGE